ncbi:hypothetical protein SAMN04489751_0617 [Brevibacterium sandarakinum]|uniref:Uncharacterized protein n=1 Tax=Brevibacterium sandarakinum TaxID=629680 RepID=A0A1H1MCX1_BRESA|nr:hypothetical protein SAMN04489751_0617 [Brevibacterium sandarakinum]
MVAGEQKGREVIAHFPPRTAERGSIPQRDQTTRIDEESIGTAGPFDVVTVAFET